MSQFGNFTTGGGRGGRGGTTSDGAGFGSGGGGRGAFSGAQSGFSQNNTGDAQENSEFGSSRGGRGAFGGSRGGFGQNNTGDGTGFGGGGRGGFGGGRGGFSQNNTSDTQENSGFGSSRGGRGAFGGGRGGFGENNTGDGAGSGGGGRGAFGGGRGGFGQNNDTQENSEFGSSRGGRGAFGGGRGGFGENNTGDGAGFGSGGGGRGGFSQNNTSDTQENSGFGSSRGGRGAFGGGRGGFGENNTGDGAGFGSGGGGRGAFGGGRGGFGQNNTADTQENSGFGSSRGGRGGFGGGRGGFNQNNTSDAQENSGFGSNRGGRGAFGGGRGGFSENNSGDGAGFGGGRGAFGGGRGGFSQNNTSDAQENSGFGSSRGGRGAFGGGRGGFGENNTGDGTGFGGGGRGGFGGGRGAFGGGRGGFSQDNTSDAQENSGFDSNRGGRGAFGGGRGGFNQNNTGDGTGFGAGGRGAFGGGRGGFGHNNGDAQENSGLGPKQGGFGSDSGRRGNATEGNFGGDNAEQGNHGNRDGEEQERTPMNYVPQARNVDDLFSEDQRAANDYADVVEHDDDVVIENFDGPVVRMQKWEEVELEPQLLTNIKERSKYGRPRKIQGATIPFILDKFDIKAQAETGSGKTAAFVVPIIDCCMRAKSGKGEELFESEMATPYAIIIGPTRELVMQVFEQAEKFAAGTGVSVAKAYGQYNIGRNHHEIRAGCDILVATPGRLKHFIKGGEIRVNKLKFLVLDEADRLLDDSFSLDIMEIVNVTGFPDKNNRQTLLFSATFPNQVMHAADQLLRPKAVFITNHRNNPNKRIKQDFVVSGGQGKLDKLTEILTAEAEKVGGSDKMRRTLVFVNTKRMSDMAALYLSQHDIPATSINGDRGQHLREQALAEFRSHKVAVLCATDVCARGIDVKELDHVINMEVPSDAITYVHRIGRCGRIAQGYSTTFIEGHEPVLNEIAAMMRESSEEIPEVLKSALDQNGGGAAAPAFGQSFAAPSNFANNVPSSGEAAAPSATEDW